MGLQFNDRVAVVTGGATGIGAAVVALLRQRGATVVILSNQPAGGDAGELHLCDVSDRAAVDRVIAAIHENHGRVDMLVNCAGIFDRHPLEDATEADVERLVRVNYIGTVNTVRAVLPFMKSRGAGEIVNVASMAAQFSSPLSAPYAGSKGAVVSFTQAMVPELVRTGIRMNAVMPAAVRTAMVEAVSNPQTDEARAMLDKLTASTLSPYGRAFLDPVDVAEVIVFLLSDAARGVHGAAMPVSDGFGAALGYT